MVKKIGKIAEAVSTNQSGAIRFLIEEGLNSGQTIMVLRQGIGRGVTGRVAHAYAAKIKSDAAQAAADRAPDDPKAHAKASAAPLTVPVHFPPTRAHGSSPVRTRRTRPSSETWPAQRGSTCPGPC